MANNETLFSEFPATTTQEWMAVVERDLKGADFYKKLVWKTYEGVDIKPFYRLEDMQNLEWLKENKPGAFPYVRGNNATENQWEIRLDIFDTDPVKANENARYSIARGAMAIGFRSVVKNGTLFGQNVQSPEDFKNLLAGIELSKTPIHLDFGMRGLEALQGVVAVASNPAEAKGVLVFDPWAEAALCGTTSGDAAELRAQFAEVFQYAKTNLPQFKIALNGTPWHNAGSSITQDRAIALATAVEALEALSEVGISPEEANANLGFTFSIGSSYFLEIAALRAFRGLWATVLESYGVAKENCKAYVSCTTSAWNKTIYDPNVNMLRTTTEAMSAVIGGCDSLSVQPYDSTFKTPDEFSYRIARNTQIILANESFFNQVVDPSGGSYYIETITDTYGKAALEIFQEIEAKGGIFAVLADGSLQGQIAQVASQKAKDVASRKDTLLGTNQFPNLLEKMDAKVAYSEGAEFTGSLPCGANPVAVEQLCLFRAADSFENLRLATERTEKAPKVFLWTQGSLVFRKARATFCLNFFGTAGYEIKDNFGFKTAEEAAAAAVEFGADIVVFCSSDEEYAEIVPAGCKLLAEKLPKAIKVVAGYPADQIESLKAAGAEDFVHMRTNAIEFLSAYNEKLGVNA